MDQLSPSSMPGSEDINQEDTVDTVVAQDSNDSAAVVK